MEADQLKNTIQDYAIEKWISKDKIGSVETPLNGEKTFIFLKALCTMPKGNKDLIHLFLSDSMTREKEARVEIAKFDEIFNTDILKDYNLQFFTYTTVSYWEGRSFGLVCCDKFQDQLTITNFKFHLNNKYQALFGVIVTVNKYSFFSVKTDPLLHAYFSGQVVSKKDMLDRIAPICFQYNIRGNYKPTVKEKKNMLNIFVIKNKLSERLCNIKKSSGGTVIYQTERDAYNSITESIKNWSHKAPGKDADLFEFEEKRMSEVKKLLNRRNNLLQSLPSKKALMEGLLFELRGQTMIYGNHLPSLEVLTPSRVLSMNNTDERNVLIKKTFEKGKLRAISSHKSISECHDLELIDNCVLKDFNYTQKEFLDRVENLRYYDAKDGNVFIIVTENTQEVTWFNEMIKDLVDYNYILCDSLVSTFKEYSKLEDK